jgi:uncharacterized heparinase superfamily protein
VVHGFHWLADLEAAGPREQAWPVAERILRLAAGQSQGASRPGKGPAWSVDNAGNRLLNWLVHAPLILSGRTRRSARSAGGDGETPAGWTAMWPG